MSNVHTMVDLETWGTGNDAQIISIGAANFDPMSDEILETFHVAVAPDHERFKFSLDPGTLMWWMNGERTKAREEWLAMPKQDIATALEGFCLWFGADKPVWGNGATFDNVILRTAFAKIGMDCPWAFWNDRCYRTLKNLAPGVTVKRVGTHHNALQDAITQAAHLQDIVNHLGLSL